MGHVSFTMFEMAIDQYNTKTAKSQYYHYT